MRTESYRDKKKLISVVVPIYNVEEYLPACIESIISQSYPNIEILLINDGSTDNSLKICNHYANIDQRIEVFTKSNGGLSDARNFGIEKSTGELITFVDSDDAIHPEMLDRLFQLRERTRADITVCKRDEIGEFEHISHIKYGTIPYKIKTYNHFEGMSAYLAGKIDTVAWGKLYPISFFKNIRFPLGKYHEDVFTTYLLIDKANKIVVDYSPLYFYRKRNNSIASMTFNHKHMDSLDGKLQQLKFLEDKYPALVNAGRMHIAYTACVLAYKMIKSGQITISDLNVLQNSVRGHFVPLINSKFVSLKTKFFAFAFLCNRNLTINLLKKL